MQLQQRNAAYHDESREWYVKAPKQPAAPAVGTKRRLDDDDAAAADDDDDDASSSDDDDSEEDRLVLKMQKRCRGPPPRRRRCEEEEAPRPTRRPRRKHERGQEGTEGCRERRGTAEKEGRGARVRARERALVRRGAHREESDGSRRRVALEWRARARESCPSCPGRRRRRLHIAEFSLDRSELALLSSALYPQPPRVLDCTGTGILPSPQPDRAPVVAFDSLVLASLPSPPRKLLKW